MNFDEILESIGPFGPYQIYNVVLIGLVQLPVGAHHLASVFLAGLPEYHCADKINTNSTTPTNESQINQDECYFYAENSTDKQECTQWEYETDVYDSTIATEWDLVCGEEWKLAFSQSLYMLGVLIGAIVFGNLSDVFGRKVAFYVGLVLMIISGTAAAFMPNYWLFVFFRLISGAAVCGAGTTGFVLIMEEIGSEYRMKPGIFYQGWFAVGYMILAVVAYFIRDFRYIQLCIGLVPIVLLPYWCLIGESPRWLLTEGHYDRAMVEIKKAARMNKKEVPESLVSKESKGLINENENKTKTKKTHTVLDLLKTPNLRRKTLITWFNWFVISMIYYGLSMGVNDLAGGPYLNLFLSGFVEFPGYIIAIFVLDRFGRKLPTAVFNMVGGLACIAMAIVPSQYGLVITCFSLLGKLAISASFSIIYVYCIELFPTVTRSIGVGSGSMCARVGGFVSPFVAFLGIYWKPLPSLIFGGSCIIAGIVVLLLPETLNQPLPETLADGESFGKYAGNSSKQREGANSVDNDQL